VFRHRDRNTPARSGWQRLRHDGHGWRCTAAKQPKPGYDDRSKVVTDGQTQVHLATKDLGVGFRTNHIVNPLERGHIAFRTDDIEAFKKRLEEKNIPYSDYGQWAMNGWYQIFFYDPAGNVIEVHQDMNE
jgi:glyoxylase I family protein